jgi:hypothetical protein
VYPYLKSCTSNVLVPFDMLLKKVPVPVQSVSVYMLKKRQAKVSF